MTLVLFLSQPPSGAQAKVLRVTTLPSPVSKVRRAAIFLILQRDSVRPDVSSVCICRKITLKFHFLHSAVILKDYILFYILFFFLKPIQQGR